MPGIRGSYRDLNRRLHETRPDYGAGIATRQCYGPIGELARNLGAKSILDYGCGKGGLGRALSHMTVIGYDPAIPGLDKRPSPADLVVCTDVLEHIEPECLDEVLDDLMRCAAKGVFLTVATRPAQKVLEDGRNAHLIQQGADWWVPKLMARWEMWVFQAQADEFVFVGRVRAKR